MGKKHKHESEAYDPKRAKKELQGKDCKHSHKSIRTNRKGKQFEECDNCNQFLGWL